MINNTDNQDLIEDELFEHFRFDVPKGQLLLRIDKFLMNLIPNATRNKIQNAASSGDIYVNDLPVKSNYKVKPLDVVRILLSHPPFENRVDPENIPLDIVFEDAALLLINKPAGLAVQGGTKIAYSIDDLSECLRFESSERPKLVHRIDKDTSGILVLARKASVAAKLSEMFRIKQMKKFYLAILQGVPKPHKGKIDFPIMKEEKEGFEKVRRNNDKGQKSLTFYQVIDFTANNFSLVQFELVTGRTHQIRIHTSLIECPILGDDKYGSRDVTVPNLRDELHLHSYKMEFEFEGKIIKLKAEIPKPFRETLNTLGLSVSS